MTVLPFASDARRSLDAMNLGGDIGGEGGNLIIFGSKIAGCKSKEDIAANILQVRASCEAIKRACDAYQEQHDD